MDLGEEGTSVLTLSSSGWSWTSSDGPGTGLSSDKVMKYLYDRWPFFKTSCSVICLINIGFSLSNLSSVE